MSIKHNDIENIFKPETIVSDFRAFFDENKAF